MSLDKSPTFQFVNFSNPSDMSQDHRRIRSHVSKLQHRKAREGRSANAASPKSSRQHKNSHTKRRSAPFPRDQQNPVSDQKKRLTATLFETPAAPLSCLSAHHTSHCSNARKLAEVRHCALDILDSRRTTSSLRGIAVKVMSWGAETSQELTPNVGIPPSVISKVLALVPSSIMVSRVFPQEKYKV